jgi:carboxyl-terminal processing protease
MRIGWLGKAAGAVVLLSTGAGGAAAQTGAADTVPASERMWIAAKMLAAVETHFAHWEGVPDLDLDAAFRDYAAKAASTADRRSFSLASMEFLARLRNGHTGFSDPWLRERYGAPLGFALEEAEGGWVVRESRLAGLEPGDRVVTVDGEPVDVQVDRLLPCISASSPREAVRKLWFMGAALWPERFTLGLADGREFEVRRGGQELLPVEPSRFEARMLDDGIAWLRIPHFETPEMEDSAIAFLAANAGAAALVVDVRRNGGGTTPTRLIGALMGRPYRGFAQSTSFDVGLYSAYHRIKQMVTPDALDDYTRGYIDAFAGFERPRLAFPGVVEHPGTPVFDGPVVILVDGGCASACEDFALPFASSGRGTLVGEPTSGSTGQPYMWSFENGMSFRVSARRVYMPDGAPFEGVGIVPDEEVRPTAEDRRRGADPVAERALEVASRAARG